MSSRTITPPVHAEFDAALADLTLQLVEVTQAAASHAVALAALVATFQALATEHPCCTRTAADMAFNVAGRLLILSMDHDRQQTRH